MEGLKYTHFLPERYLLLRVFENGSVVAIRADGSTRAASAVEILEMRTQRKEQ